MANTMLGANSADARCAGRRARLMRSKEAAAGSNGASIIAIQSPMKNGNEPTSAPGPNVHDTDALDGDDPADPGHPPASAATKAAGRRSTPGRAA
jgi:hypothetical protein